LSYLNREAAQPLIGQIVDAFAEAIDSGELSQGEKLPTTRELAELAGVNHLTAARAYRRLAERGLVTARVGRGTFVRAASAEAEARGSAPDRSSWQLYALPEESETYGDRILTEMFRHAGARDPIPLMVGYPDAGLFPVEQIRRISAAILESEPERALQYTDVEGVPELREQLALLGERRGGVGGADETVVTSGARQALTLAARAILRPGDVAACESPSFVGVIEALRNTGARVLPVPVDDEGLDLDALEQLLRRHEVRLLAVQPRLHNPTGVDLSPERRRRLSELARRRGLFILEDGVYGDLRFAGERLPPLRTLAPEHVIYVDSLSKSVGSGLRTGWVVATGPVLDRIVREKRNDDMTSPTLPQLIAARFLAAGEYERHLERIIPIHRERCEALIEAIESELGTIASASRPQGGAHVWVRLHDRLDEQVLYAEAVRQGVSFHPGGAAMPERPRSTSMRLSFGLLSPDEIREGVRRLARAVRTVRKTRRPAKAMPIA
jgi:2-aminoadipate transaminase